VFGARLRVDLMPLESTKFFDSRHHERAAISVKPIFAMHALLVTQRKARGLFCFNKFFALQNSSANVEASSYAAAS